MKIITIGRSPGNNIVIDDKKVSAKHIAITLSETGQYYVQDLNSTNGTLVNQQKIGNKPIEIKPKDQIKIGDTLLPWTNYFEIQKQDENQTSATPATTPSQKSSDDLSPIQTIQKTNSIKNRKQQNQILWVGLILLLIIFIGLLMIWYVNYVIAPELSLNLLMKYDLFYSV